MSTLHAFKLRDDVSLDELVGASISYGPETRLFDIKEALDKGNGTIVTNDDLLANTLRGSELLVEGEAPSNHDGVTLAPVPGGGLAAQAQRPVLFEPQNGIADPQPVPEDVPAQHEPEPDTVEAAVQQGASPTETAPADTTPIADTPPAPTTRSRF